jgi:hypothetical protein
MGLSLLSMRAVTAEDTNPDKHHDPEKGNNEANQFFQFKHIPRTFYETRFGRAVWSCPFILTFTSEIPNCVYAYSTIGTRV